MGLWVTFEHTEPYPVRNLMTRHWGCLSNGEPYWRQVARGREREEGTGAGDEWVGVGVGKR